MQHSRWCCFLMAGAIAFMACGGGAVSGREHASPASGIQTASPRTPDKPIRCGIEMRNVNLRVQDEISLQVQALEGELVSRVDNAPPTFDDPQSFVLRLQSGDFSMDAPTLTRLLRANVFNDPRSSVRQATVSFGADGITVKGRLHKGIDVPFSMKATVETTSDGRLRLRSTSLKAAGIPVKGLLDLFGVELENLLKVPAGRGISTDADDLLLDPFAMLPPPTTEGRVKAVRIDGDRLVLVAAGSSNPPPRPRTRPDPAARNFVYFHGGIVTFGKLTMRDADLQLVDASPRDPFDFFPGRYSEQLIAGYSRNTPRGGLKVMMPDYHRAHAGQVLPPPKIVK